MGRIILYIVENKKCLKPPTSSSHIFQPLLVGQPSTRPEDSRSCSRTSPRPWRNRPQAHPKNMNKKKQFHDLSTMIISYFSFSKTLEMHLLSKTCWGSTLRAAAALASQLIMKPIWNLNGFQSNRTILQTQSSPTFKLSWQTWYSKRLCPELLECEPKIFRCPIYNWENTMIASTHLSFW